MMPLLPALLLVLSTAAAPAPAPEEPFFQALDGTRVHASDHLGEVVVLNFWATWCGPCRTEMPVLVKLHDELGSKVHLIAAAANGPGDAEAVRAMMKQMDMRFEVWLWVSAADMRHYGVGPGIPATVVLDKDGKVRARLQGVVTREKLQPILDELLTTK